MPSYEAFRLMDLLHRFDVSLVSDLPGDQVRYLGFFPVNDIQAWTTALTGIGYVIPFGENILPRIGPTATPRLSFRSRHHG